MYDTISVDAGPAGSLLAKKLDKWIEEIIDKWLEEIIDKFSEEERQDESDTIRELIKNGRFYLAVKGYAKLNIQ